MNLEPKKPTWFIRFCNWLLKKKNAPEGLLKLLIVKYDLFEVKISDHWEERKSICGKCTKSIFCPECGCVIEAKVLIDKESCPLGKWKQ